MRKNKEEITGVLDSPDESSDLSLIIPARNESKRINSLLQSIHQQSIKPREVIVVDDNSEDGTASLVAEAGFTVVASGKLPEGWIGKSWACWRGASEASGKFLLFLDADTRLARDGIAKILGTINSQGGAFAVQPYHNIIKPYENLSAFFNIIVMMGTNLFTPLGKFLKAKAFFGPCIVCRRSDYFKVGGHEKVKGSVLEDIALGNLFRDGGVEVFCYGGKGTIDFRMYPGGLAEILEGWGKNFGSGAASIGLSTFILISCWITGSISASIGLLRSIINNTDILQAMIIFLIYGIQITWMLRRIGNFSYSIIILYPVGQLFFLFTFIYSLVMTLFVRRVTWKGRKIETGR